MATNSPNFLPRRAVVTPRARKAHGGAALPVEQLVRSLLDAHARGFVVLTGSPGIGKTTALQHLAITLPQDAPVTFMDDPRADEIPNDRPDRLTIIATSGASPAVRTTAEYELAGWSEDDFIEYLAARHRNRCASVLARLHADADRGAIGGSPQLWRLILDEMAGDESISTASQALRRCLAELLLDQPTQCAVGEVVLNHTLNGSAPPERIFSAPQFRQYLLRHRPVQTIHAAKYLARALVESGGDMWLTRRLPRELVRETAAIVRQSSAISEKLMELLRKPNRRTDAMAASILLASDPSWRPWVGRALWFTEAQLHGARWAGIDLQDSELAEADLSGADLTGANLNRVEAGRTCFAGAILRAASLDGFRATGADFSRADFSTAAGDTPIFSSANFEGASLQDVSFQHAEFLGANFNASNCNRAILTNAVLWAPTVTDADFIGANLTGAKLHQIKMHEATWTGATFQSASLSQCDFEGIELPHANFAAANLTGCLFTGTRMPRGNFRGANLRDTGLAEIEWEQADLRNADLRGTSFHMGTTRSGLVGSTTPSEGSRTGFYTDDFSDQEFKSPEEIRKANLCGADLRGANVEGVDFYLVDLRGAKYTTEQAEHFARCGAILRPCK